MTEILVEDDMTDVTRSNSVDPAPPDDASNGACHVEFQVNLNNDFDSLNFLFSTLNLFKGDETSSRPLYEIREEF